MRKRREKNRVVVAMSGGVDSSVAAALLKRESYDLAGVFMKFWSAGDEGGANNRCCSLEDEKRARRVAAKLRIPFYIFDFRKEFKKRIVGYFLKEYELGRTPNPCVACNKEIKFGLLLEKAMGLNADYVATGHYAKILGKEPTRLLKGRDENKDQSYFLWQLNQKQLKRILLPLGDYNKSRVKDLAKKFSLPISNIAESQEICFIQGKTNDFLKRYLRPRPGKITDRQGKVLGGHRGLPFYTVGQRKGLELSGGPHYVFKKKQKNNILIVTTKEKDLLGKELLIKRANWISGKEPKLPLRVKAKIRHRHKLVSATVYKLRNKNYKVVFDRAQRAITPGQSAVFYKGQEVLGGGIIN